MIVVADTSPISYLVLIKEIDILPKIYGAVVVPEIVARELRQQSAPEVVREWGALFYAVCQQDHRSILCPAFRNSGRNH